MNEPYSPHEARLKTDRRISDIEELATRDARRFIDGVNAKFPYPPRFEGAAKEAEGETQVNGKEIVTRPEHYTKFKVEPITFIMGNNLGFAIGNIVKYAVRAGSKLYPGKDAVESEILDLEKVRRYAEMRINQLRGKDLL